MKVRALFGVQPKLDHNGVDGETDPECDAEELVWTKVRKGARGKERTHNRASRGDA